jgi:hypothetical protein
MQKSKGQKDQKKRAKRGRPKVAFSAVRAALIKCWGNISQTAEELQINYFSLAKILAKWPKLREYQKAAGEMRLDKTEQVYWKLIDEYSDPQTVRHHLETKGKGRGYGKQPETAPPEEPEKQAGEPPTLEELAREEAQLTRELAALDRKERREKKQQRNRAPKNRAKAKKAPNPTPDKRTKNPGSKAKKRLSSIHPSDQTGLQTRPTPRIIGQDDRGNDSRGLTPLNSPDAPTPR